MTIIEKIKNSKEILATITAYQVLVIAGYGVISKWLDYSYSIKAGNFYKIPKKYFMSDLLEERIFVLVYVVVFCLMLIFPIFVKKAYKKTSLGWFGSLFYSVMIAPLCGIYSLYFSLEIVIGILRIEGYDGLLIAIALVITCVSFVIFFLVLKIDFSTDEKEIKKQSANSERKGNEISKKQNWVLGIYAVLVGGQCASIFILGWNKLDKNPEDINKYEIITIQSDTKTRKAAVITEKDGNLLVMNIEENKKKEGELILNSKNYYFVDRKDCMFEYKRFESVKVISKNEEK